MGAPVGIDFSALPALATSRAASLALVEDLTARLSAALTSTAAVITVAAAGSLGRLEATGSSDFDGIVVIADDAAEDPAEVVYAALTDSALALPKPWGIYRQGIRVGALCAPAARGALDETPTVFGKRIQFLLDTRPLYAPKPYVELQTRILEWYSAPGLASDPDRQWTLLINDLQRYLHAYAAWQQYKFERDATDGWYLRQAKLRGSRLLTFAGLVLLLGASSRQRDKPAWLLERLALTPFERVQAVMCAYDDTMFRCLATHYEAVHALLSEPANRAALAAQSPGCEADLPSVWPAPYAAIHRHGGQILRLLTHFVLARRGDWHPDFFGYLMF